MSQSGRGTTKTEWDRDAAVFLKDVLASIKTREAVAVGTKAVEYFRGIDYTKYINDHEAEIRDKHKVLCEKVAETSDAAELATRLGEYLLIQGFIAKTEHAPLPGLDQSKIPAHLRDNAKWPRRVKVARNQTQFSSSSFYAINYEAPSAYSMVMLGGTIAVVLLFCMFPIWPFGAKIAAWYILVSFMTLLLVCMVLRLILFVGIWFCGRDFWLFPNLFDEDAGVIESFIPLYTYHKRDDDWLMVAVRIFAAILTGASFYKLGETHSLADIGDVGVGAFLDILEWGHTKLGGNSTALQANQNYEALLSPEERLNRHYDLCVKHCEFQDVDEFDEFCARDCHCLNELWQSRCWRSCEYDVRDDLKAKLKLCKDNNGVMPGQEGTPSIKPVEQEDEEREEL